MLVYRIYTILIIKLNFLLSFLETSLINSNSHKNDNTSRRDRHRFSNSISTPPMYNDPETHL